MPAIQLEFVNAILFHAGNKEHEVQLRGVSERELKFLRSLHGADNVPPDRVEKLGLREVDERLHFYEMARKYGSHEDLSKQEVAVKRIEKLFNVDLGDFHEWLDRTTQAEDEQKTAAGRQRAAEAALYAHKREEEIRAEAEAKVKASLAESLGMSVSDLDVLAKQKPAVPAPA